MRGERMENSISGASVLVIGASAGIGREVARAFADRGARVMAVGRREANLRELAEGSSVEWTAADITEPGEPDRVVARAVAAFGGLDIVVNVAAASPMGLLADADPDALLAVFASNVVAPSQMCRAALAHLGEGGIIGFVSSETVGRPRKGLVPYGASKAALEELVNGWRVENPHRRFATIRVGATIGTDFGRDFSGELLGDCIEDWIRGGHIAASMMEPVPVGTAIAEILSVGFAHPTIELTDFAIRPPGPLATLD